MFRHWLLRFASDSSLTLLVNLEYRVSIGAGGSLGLTLDSVLVVGSTSWAIVGSGHDSASTSVTGSTGGSLGIGFDCDGWPSKDVFVSTGICIEGVVLVWFFLFGIVLLLKWLLIRFYYG